MSVFTPLSDDQIRDLLRPFGLKLVSARVATEGISNSNYLLRCHDPEGVETGTVLTVFEQQDALALRWYADLLSRLAAADLPVPAPLTCKGIQ